MRKHIETLHTNTKRHVIRVGGILKEIVTVYDKAGNTLHKMTTPLMLEFKAHDLMQVIVGATILAVPVSFTEEVWVLGSELSNNLVTAIMLVSFIFVSIFIYYNSYTNNFKSHWLEFFKRSLATYIFAFIVSSLILTLVDKAPWSTEWVLAVKRAIIVSLPASMSAAVADMIK